MTNLQDILNKEFTNPKGEKALLRDIIDENRDLYELGGNKIFKAEAIYKLRKFVGAVFLPPEYKDYPGQFNDKAYILQCAIKFPDGEISYATGEANNINTWSISRKYKATMAEKRGYARAFLKSNFIGLFEVYSEDESDSFTPMPTENASYEQENPVYVEPEIENQNNEEKSENTEVLVLPPTELLFLPNTDSKYPGEHIFEDVLKKHRDFEYLDTIVSAYPDNNDYVTAAKFLKNMIDNKLNRSDKPVNEINDEIHTQNETEIENDEDSNHIETTIDNSQNQSDIINSSSPETNKKEKTTRRKTKKTAELVQMSPEDFLNSVNNDFNEIPQDNDLNTEKNDDNLKDAENFLES